MIVKQIITTNNIKSYRIQVNGKEDIKVQYDHNKGIINFINKEI